MLQNIRVIAFTVSELLRENQQRMGGGEGGGLRPSPTQIKVKILRIVFRPKKLIKDKYKPIKWKS